MRNVIEELPLRARDFSLPDRQCSIDNNAKIHAALKTASASRFAEVEEEDILQIINDWKSRGKKDFSFIVRQARAFIC